MSQIRFTPGQFQKFRATTTVHLGPIGRDLNEDVVVEFDGITLKMEGETFSMPTLKGGVLGGWLVPAADTTTTYMPQPAGIQINAADQTKAQPASRQASVVSQEEQVVGQINARNARPAMPSPQAGRQATAQFVPGRKQLPNGQQVPAWFDETALPPWPNRRDFKSEKDFSLATDEYNAAVIQQIAYGTPIQKPDSFGGNLQSSSDTITGREVGGGKFRVQAMDGQQGSVIGQVKTSSKSALVGADGDPKLREWTGRTDRAAPIDAVRGESAGTLIRDEGAIRNLQAQIGGPPQWQTPTTTVGSAPQAAVIDDGVDPAHIRTAMPTIPQDDLVITVDTSLGEVMGDMAVSTPAPTPGAVVGNAVAQRKTPEESIREIVSTWDKGQHWRARVSEAVDFYGDQPAIIDAICEIESPGIVKRIRAGVAKLGD